MIYSKLSNLISSHIDIKEEEMDLIKSFFKYESAAKGAFLIEVGCITDTVFFILSGYLRYFKMTDAGEEVVIHLYASDHFATSLNSFFLGEKSAEKLQAITDCEYLYISRSDLEKLFSINQAWQSFGRKMMESFLIEKEERIIDYLSLTAHDRYCKLIKNQPDIIHNVPVKDIASFIGVQPESLSRIRGSIANIRHNK